MRTTWLRALTVAGLLLGSACGEDEVVVPTADELADRLIDVDTFAGDWTVEVPPDVPDAASGIVPEDQQDQLPRMDLCEAATDEQRAAFQDVRWMAFRQITLAVDDPIQPPDDRTGHMVFVQEFLTSGEPDEVEQLYGLMHDGMQACVGEIPAGEEGPGLAEAIELPDVGDDRYGVLATMDETGGWAEWRLHSVLVRDGAVLMSLVITDIRADAEPFYTVEDIGQMTQTAVDLL